MAATQWSLWWTLPCNIPGWWRMDLNRLFSCPTDMVFCSSHTAKALLTSAWEMVKNNSGLPVAACWSCNPLKFQLAQPGSGMEHWVRSNLSVKNRFSIAQVSLSTWFNRGTVHKFTILMVNCSSGSSLWYKPTFDGWPGSLLSGALQNVSASLKEAECFRVACWLQVSPANWEAGNQDATTMLPTYTRHLPPPC